ncbi:AraC family transcriptional regulator [Sciscionella marina]|uniref:AraC family transcriptional regulator n=1 Tax=Sciscionella marina TaxID=508770 RepID=UPI000380B265|nr:AraC family transcriptional regulator [Sciscionella marina]
MFSTLPHTGQQHMTDVDQARAVVQRSMCPHDLEMLRRDGHLDATMWSRRLRDTSVNDIAYGDDVQIVPGRLESFFVAMIPLSGNSVIRCGGQEAYTGPGIAAVPNPDEWLSMRWTGACAQRVVRFELPALHARLAQMLGRPLYRGPLNLDLTVDLNAGEGRAFAEDVARVANRMEYTPELYRQHNLIAVTEESLMTFLLLAANHNYREDLDAEPAPASSRIVRSSLDILHNDTDRYYTQARLAGAVGVSTRTLERKFQETLGVSPMNYYKSVRLDRVHQKLLAADPETATVADIARGEGFLNRGRFAADYRHRFGRPPSDTLAG